MCVKVLLADDAEVMRKAIRRLLSECEDISLVGEATKFSEAVQKAQELLPDEVVLDLRGRPTDLGRICGSPQSTICSQCKSPR